MRSYVNYHQNNWPRVLSTAQYRFNNNVNTVTSKTLFSLILYFTPTIRINPTTDSIASEKTPDTRYKVKTREELSKTYQEIWMKTQEVIRRYYNKRRKTQLFEEDQKILLSIKYIRVRKLYRKLTDRFLGSFKITKRVGENVY